MNKPARQESMKEMSSHYKNKLNSKKRKPKKLAN